MTTPNPSRDVRLAEYFRRLHDAVPAAGFDEAFRLVGEVMNQIEQIQSSLLSRFPGLETKLDPPLNREKGTWHLDIARDGTAPVVVEWWPGQAFGVSTLEDDAAFGVGVDELYQDAAEVIERVAALILSGGRAVPPVFVTLQDLRRTCGMSQTELALRAGVKQANISRIESRGDILLSTLSRVVEAMGAKLEICARFPNGAVRQLRVGNALEGATDEPSAESPETPKRAIPISPVNASA